MQRCSWSSCCEVPAHQLVYGLKLSERCFQLLACSFSCQIGLMAGVWLDGCEQILLLRLAGQAARCHAAKPLRNLAVLKLRRGMCALCCSTQCSGSSRSRRTSLLVWQLLQKHRPPLRLRPSSSFCWKCGGCGLVRHALCAPQHLLAQHCRQGFRWSCFRRPCAQNVRRRLRRCIAALLVLCPWRTANVAPRHTSLLLQVVQSCIKACRGGLLFRLPAFVFERDHIVGSVLPSQEEAQPRCSWSAASR